MDCEVCEGVSLTHRPIYHKVFEKSFSFVLSLKMARDHRSISTFGTRLYINPLNRGLYRGGGGHKSEHHIAGASHQQVQIWMQIKHYLLHKFCTRIPFVKKTSFKMPDDTLRYLKDSRLQGFALLQKLIIFRRGRKYDLIATRMLS